MEIKGNHEEAFMEIIIRDFDRRDAERRVAALESFARTVEAQFPGGRVEVNAKPQYYNMREKIEACPEVLEILKKAAGNVGVAFRLKPIRGGTDGSRLTELGIPTPNIFTGGRNYHSRVEWVSVPEMMAACKVVIELIRLGGTLGGYQPHLCLWGDRGALGLGGGVTGAVEDFPTGRKPPPLPPPSVVSKPVFSPCLSIPYFRSRLISMKFRKNRHNKNDAYSSLIIEDTHAVQVY
jgi:hypothetical protein